jgi:large subunit ribosomal protein L18
MASKSKEKAVRAIKRRRRVRSKIFGTAGTPRLTVAKSLRHIYAQIIDDAKQVTIIGLGSGSGAMAGKIEEKDTKIDVARKVGQTIAELALEKGIRKVIFDRNRFLYHGRIKAVAGGARDKGLQF